MFVLLSGGGEQGALCEEQVQFVQSGKILKQSRGEEVGEPN